MKKYYDLEGRRVYHGDIVVPRFLSSMQKAEGIGMRVLCQVVVIHKDWWLKRGVSMRSMKPFTRGKIFLGKVLQHGEETY